MEKKTPDICRFFKQGFCRDGDKCRFLHPKLDNAQATKNAGKSNQQKKKSNPPENQENSRKHRNDRNEQQKNNSAGKSSMPKERNPQHPGNPDKNSQNKGPEKNENKRDKVDLSQEMNIFLKSIEKKLKEKQLHQPYFIKQLDTALWKSAIELLAENDSRLRNYSRYIRPLLLIYLYLPETMDSVPNIHHLLLFLCQELKQIQKAKHFSLILDIFDKRLLHTTQLQSITSFEMIKQVDQDIQSLDSIIKSSTPQLISKFSNEFSEILEYISNVQKKLSALKGELKKIRIPEKKTQEPEYLDMKNASNQGQAIDGWYNAPTIDWLLNGGWYTNTQLQLRYDSVEDYASTLQKLWTQLSFYWGMAAFWPKCKHRFDQPKDGKAPAAIGGGDIKMCNAPLLCSVVKVVPCSMRRRGGGLCTNMASWSCHQRGHDAICNECVGKKVQNATFGPAPDRRDLSTDIYDAVVTDLRHHNESLILNFQNVLSRKPPEKAVNWKTSYRLQPACLVGVVKLHATHATIPMSSPIYWGEIVLQNSHDEDMREYSRRERGYLTVRLLSKADSQLLPTEVEYPFTVGSKAAIVDFRVFVPEVFSVLATISHPVFKTGLERLPFKHSLLGWNREEEERVQFDYSLPDLCIHNAILHSKIPSIQTLSGDQKVALTTKILALNLVKTLDRTQLEAFCKGLMCNFHCTQGPPGTGKSYVGVCLVLALNLIRNLLYKDGRVVGPILTLSYKNHALDEFLKDVKDNCSDLAHNRGKLIRIGKPELEELLPYTERSSTAESEAKRMLDERLQIMRRMKVSLQSWMKMNLGIYEIHNVADILNKLKILADEIELIDVIEPLKPAEAYGILRQILNERLALDGDLLLIKGAEHWPLPTANSNRVVELLLRWLNGEKPPLRCQKFIFPEQNNPVSVIQCIHCAAMPSSFCSEVHSCIFQGCLNQKSNNPPNSRRCGDHKCSVQTCIELKLAHNIGFCKDHLCPLCYETPKAIVGAEACRNHTCTIRGCQKIIFAPFDFCLDHMCKECLQIGYMSNQAKQIYFQRNQLSDFCGNHKCADKDCNGVKLPDLPFCELHACRICGERAAFERLYCENHNCMFEDGCTNARMIHPTNGMESLYCVDHTCSICFQLGAELTQSAYPPRFTCASHELCQFVYQEDGSSCDCLIDLTLHSSYCPQHIPKFYDGKCNGIAKKTGKPCKSIPMKDQLFCHVHMDQAQTKQDYSKLMKFQPILAPQRPEHSSFSEKPKESKRNVNNVFKCGTCSAMSFGDPNWKCCLHSIDQKNAWPVIILKEENSHTEASREQKVDPVVSESKQKQKMKPIGQANKYHNDFEEDEEDGKQVIVEDELNGNMNADEIEIPVPLEPDQYEDENENTERVRLKEIYQEEQDEDEDEDKKDGSDLEEEMDEDPFNIEEMTAFLSQEENERFHQGIFPKEKILKVLNIQEWNWEMTLEERRHYFGNFLHCGFHLLKLLIFIADRYVDEARRMKSEASALALKQAAVIGGTIVGAARRLTALRAAEPFAIVVEEACEVMEPTLVSVLAVESLEKLELIGDQRQLPAFIQNCWYNIEVSNPSIKKSLFERLVETEDGGVNTEECTLLDIQRRMRVSISNLTKTHYEDVVQIIDHPKTATQKVGDRLKLTSEESAYKRVWLQQGRQVPGLRSSIYFWNMTGNKESKPKAGLSACNENEAQATASLVKYFLNVCGVPPSCITIITPYQGQKRELISILRKEKCLERNKPQLMISTVDRYQGDENDIVILSLVRTRPGNRFVSLLNRFIVASSRARLGFYIVGSVDAVVEGWKEEKGSHLSLRGSDHWKGFIAHLTEPDEETVKDDNYLIPSRISSSLPICCPQHPQSTRMISSNPNERQFPSGSNWAQFCRVKCSHTLPCSHACNLPCHVFNLTAHNASCEVKLLRPCALHSMVPVLCRELTFSTPNMTLDQALEKYSCTIPRDIILPHCDHSINRPCFEAYSMEMSRIPYPDCQEIVEDFIQPTCGHIIYSPKCFERRKYEKRPPTCHEIVEKRRPTCIHSVRSECYQIDNELKKECKKDVNIPRPRCGHQLSLRCYETNILMNNWNILTMNELEDWNEVILMKEVHEGHRYELAENEIWSKATICENSINFVRTCGHRIPAMKCHLAFKYAQNPVSLPICKEIQTTQCKLCQEEIRIPCHQYQRYQNWQPFEQFPYAKPLDVGDPQFNFFGQDALELIPAQTISENDLELWKLLKNKCKHHSNPLFVIRSCNVKHMIKLSCSQFISIFMLKDERINNCTEKMTRVLSCHHTIQVDCYKLEEMPPPKCLVKPTEPYYYANCNHSLVVSTCSQLEAMKANPSKYPCEIPVTASLPRCNHPTTIPCHLLPQLQNHEVDGLIGNTIYRVSDQMILHNQRLFIENRPTDDEMLLIHQDLLYCIPCPALPVCTREVAFERRCSHLYQGKINCSQAFEFALGRKEPSKCQAKIITRHPICQHNFETECWVNHCFEVWSPWKSMRIPNQSPVKRDYIHGPDGINKEVIALNSLAPYIPCPETITESLLCCSENILVQFHYCSHIKPVKCYDVYSKFQTIYCEELCEDYCLRTNCQKLRYFSCYEMNHKTSEERHRHCKNMVEKICSICQINSILVKCSDILVECKREVKIILPCSHEVTWKCGQEEDLRYFNDPITKRNSRCLQCNISLWQEINGQIEFELPFLQNYCFKKLQQLFPSYQLIAQAQAEVLATEGGKSTAVAPTPPPPPARDGEEFKQPAADEEEEEEQAMMMKKQNQIQYINLPVVLDAHEGSKSQAIRRLIQAFQEKKLISFPPQNPANYYLSHPPETLEQYLDDHYEFVFLEMKMDKIPNLFEVGKRRFSMDKITPYGRGLQVKKISRHAFYSLDPAELNGTATAGGGGEEGSGKVRLLIGLVFRCNLLQQRAPFTIRTNFPNNNPPPAPPAGGDKRGAQKGGPNNNAAAIANEEKQVNQTRQQYINQGYDCVQVMKPAAAAAAKEEDGNELVEFVFWHPGTAIALQIIEMTLHIKCSICGDSYPNDARSGCSCPSKHHFTCWSCLSNYMEAAQQPGAISSYVNADGHLTCPECKDPYDLTTLTSGGKAPKEMIDAFIQLKLMTKVTEERQVIVKEEKLKFEKELKRIQEMDEFERNVELLRKQIIEKIFSLHCPRCETVFMDFEGCFALTCGANRCHAGFCAWCLQDCGEDAHSHVPNCRLNARPGQVYGDLNELHGVHNRVRMQKITDLLRNHPSNIKKRLKEIMKKDFEDLGIPLTFF
jgi:hypothetical protein